MSLHAKKTRTLGEQYILWKDAVARHGYSNDDVGIWLVKGADVGNTMAADTPTLGYFKGRFIDVVKCAVEFVHWTGYRDDVGGTIEKIEVEEI